MDVKVALSRLAESSSRIFHRFHVVIFVVLVAGLMSLATLTLSSLLASSGGSDEPAGFNGFDTQTIEKVKTLKTPDEQTEYTPPSNQRISPFSE